MIVRFLMLTAICAHHGLGAHYIFCKIFCMSIGPSVRPFIIS